MPNMDGRDISDTLNRFKPQLKKYVDSSLAGTKTRFFDGLAMDAARLSWIARQFFTGNNDLYQHAMKVWMLGMAILNELNYRLNPSRTAYKEHELKAIAVGYVLHDIGKLTLPEAILKKKGALTQDELKTVQRHSYDQGVKLLIQHNLTHPFVLNSIKYHHVALFVDEPHSYPDDPRYAQLPLYLKTLKIADIYAAMTSRRTYREAVPPEAAIQSIINTYRDKNRELQLVLRTFVDLVAI